MNKKAQKKTNLVQRTAFLGMMTALALIVTYVETLIPFQLGIPGAKIGLTNIVILLVLYRGLFSDALLVSVVRIVAVGFLFGNLSAILYSMAGGLLSLVVMQLLKKSKAFGMLGVSVAGGVSHNLGQLLAAMAVLDSISLVYYLPFLMIAGVVTGFCIGAAAQAVMKHVSKTIY